MVPQRAAVCGRGGSQTARCQTTRCSSSRGTRWFQRKNEVPGHGDKPTALFEKCDEVSRPQSHSADPHLNSSLEAAGLVEAGMALQIGQGRMVCCEGVPNTHTQCAICCRGEESFGEGLRGACVSQRSPLSMLAAVQTQRLDILTDGCSS